MHKTPTFTVISLIVAALITASSDAAELVVVNPACAATTVTPDALKALYNGRKRALPDGERVEILTVADPSLHERFLADYVHTTPDEFTTYWQRLVFIGQGKMPRSFANEKDLIAYIAATPGTIGYIDAATAHDGVKVLTISH